MRIDKLSRKHLTEMNYSIVSAWIKLKCFLLKRWRVEGKDRRVCTMMSSA